VFKLALCNTRIIALLSALAHKDDARKAALLASAQQQLRTLKKLSSPLSSAFATLWSSVFCALHGDTQRALTEAQKAQPALVRLHGTYGTLVTYWEGWLEGGEAGRLKRGQALALMRDKGWADPKRAMAMLMPVFHLVQASP
jgi:hypothetical protein